MGPLIVIGLGNILLRDEGVGVRVVQELEREVASAAVDVPPGTEFVDGGTLGLDLLPLIGNAGSLVLVDAVDVGRPPGSVVVIRGDDVEGVLTGHVSPHQVGVADLVAAARLIGILPGAFSLVGIQPSAIEVGFDLTPAVETALADATAAIRAELDRFASSSRVAA